MDAGGIPYWVRAKTTKRYMSSSHSDGLINMRTNDIDWIEAVSNYLHLVNALIQPYLYTNGGGPIILYAIENELNWFLDGVELEKLANLADGMPERSAKFEPELKEYMEKLMRLTIDVSLL